MADSFSAKCLYFMCPLGRLLFLPTFLPTCRYFPLPDYGGGEGYHGFDEYLGYLTSTPKGFWDLKGLAGL